SVPVFYSSAWPIKRVNDLWSCFRLRQFFIQRNRAKPFDLALIWNLKKPQIVCANYALKDLRIPVVLEYEDDAFVSVQGGRSERLGWERRLAQDLLARVPGCMACSPRLLSQLPSHIPKLLLRGVVGRDLEAAREEKRNRVLFSGSHHKQYGI